MKGSVVFVVIVAACAASGTERVSPRDPWTYSLNAKPRRGDPIRCSQGTSVPTCESEPTPAELSPIDGSLRAKLGRKVTVASRPQVSAGCTRMWCGYCCNHCTAHVVLDGSDPGSLASIKIGQCQGDDCTLCCTIAVHDRVLIARGVLARSRERGAHETAFVLENPEYCYLEDGS
jgi:hypothetical protein